MEPITRREKYFAKQAGQNVVVPEPITREEHFLKAILEAGGGGGGPIAQSDWNAAEGEPGHVLNRTHWEAPEEQTISIDFDGNTNGKEIVKFMGMTLVKVSTHTPSLAELKEATYSVHDAIAGETTTKTMAEWAAEGNKTVDEYVVQETEPPVALVNSGNIVVVYEPYTNDMTNINFTVGTYVVYFKGTEYGSTSHIWCSNLTYNTIAPTVHQLDPKYIKDMYYDKSEEYNFTYDGDLTGKETVQLGEGMYFVKVSDTILTAEELKKGTISFFRASEDGTMQETTTTAEQFAEDNGVSVDEIIMDATSQTGIPALTLAEYVVSVYAPVSNQGMTITTGTYFTHSEGWAYTSAFSCVSGEIHKIPEKYMPDIPYFDLTAMGLPNLTMDGVPATLQADCSEIVKALEKGSVKFRYCVDYTGQMLEMILVCNAVNIPAAGVHTTGSTFLLQIGETFLPIAISLNFLKEQGLISGVVMPLQPMSM